MQLQLNRIASAALAIDFQLLMHTELSGWIGIGYHLSFLMT